MPPLSVVAMILFLNTAIDAIRTPQLQEIAQLPKSS